MSKRLIVDTEVNDCYVDFYDVIDGKTPQEIAECMEYYKQRFEGRDVYFNIESYGYDGGKELKLRERREENDRDYEKRLVAEKKVKDAKKKIKADKEARDIAEYERLKKKFGA
jgi:hypothetical protein